MTKDAGVSQSEADSVQSAVARRDPMVRANGNWRLRNWPLRTKLVIILLIPTLTALVLIGLRFITETGSAARLAELSARVRSDTAVAKVVHSLQGERDRSVQYLASSRAEGLEDLKGQRGRVDAEIGAFGKTFSAVRDELSDPSEAALSEVNDRLKSLGNLRFGVDANALPSSAVLESYGELISALLDARQDSVSEISDPALVRLQMANTSLGRMKDQLSITRALITEVLIDGQLRPEIKRKLNTANSAADFWWMNFSQFATPEQRKMYEDTVTDQIVYSRGQTVETVLASADTGKPLAGLDQRQWLIDATFTNDLVSQVEDGLLAVMQENTDTLAEAERTSAMRDAAIVLSLLLLAAILTVVISRSLLRPLRILRTSALRVADYQLPAAVHGILADPQGGRDARIDPVPVYSREELGQVARAFDAVHGEALRLAIEQATLRENVYTMFVNLALRGQELYERQLAVLDRMEAEESDPDHLARLFELDHLATRGRRICENLLVLSGNHSGRMLPGSVAASDVLGAAISEIEHYQRVRLGTVPLVGVRGDVVSDVVHVISELLENATADAMHDVIVTVVSNVTDAGDLRVDITDNGPGMAQEAIDDANARLEDPPVVDLEVARRMGLYVVARLAQRNGLRVRLSPASGGGLTATVLVPSELISDMFGGADKSAIAERARRQERLDAALEHRYRSPIGPPGPPKRAPVVNESSRLAPRSPEPHPLDDDQPTESMPVYRELLTRWFDQNRPMPPGHPEEDDSVDSGPLFEPHELAAGQQRGARGRDIAESEGSEDQVEQPDLDPPTLRSTRSLDAAIGVNSKSGAAPEEPAPTPASTPERAPGTDPAQEPERPTPASAKALLDDHFGIGEEPSENSVEEVDFGPISRSPEAVKSRMISLVEGVRRARQTRGDEYADRGSAATVGAGSSGRLREREGSGGKEG